MENRKNYTVKDFCNKYNNMKSDQAKEALLGNIMKPSYVPYETKITTCKNIIEIAYHTTIQQNEVEIKEIYFDSPSEYMLYCLELIKQYTNIEVNFKNSLEDFNLLNEYGLLDIIIANIPEKELKEFRMILDMVENDVIRNEYEIHAFISNKIDNLVKIANSALKPALGQLAKAFENIDQADIADILAKLKKLDQSEN